MAAKSNCPWSLPVESGPATSLKDVMDEQLATDLQDKEKLYKSWECFAERIPHNRL